MTDSRNGHGPRSAAAALRHPLFWVALGVLVLNDHVLKGAGVLPGLVTGKISDFAGLIVAPLVFTALLGGRRSIAFAAVGGWFVGVNLSPAFAQQSVAAMGLIGFEWRLWTDPTDLIALAVLPISWHMAAQSAPTLRYGKTLELSALVLGLFACMATSNPDPDPRPPVPPPPPMPVPPPPPMNVLSLQNHAAEAVELRVRWLEGTVDCDLVEPRLAEAIGRDSFGTGVTYLVDSGAYASLDQDRSAECSVAFLQSTEFGERILFWRPRGLGLGETIIEIVTGSAGPELVAPAAVTLAEPLEAATTAECDWRAAANSYGWSALSFVGSPQRLDAIEPTIDDCLSLTFSDEAGEPGHLYLCVPADDLIFLPGDWLRFDERFLEGSGRTLDVWRVSDPAVVDPEPMVEARMAVHVDARSVVVDRYEAMFNAEGSCDGERLACGAYREAGAVAVYDERGATLIGPGSYLDFTLDISTRARLRIGRAEQFVFTRPGCGAGRDQLGTHIDAVVTYWEE